MFGKKIAKEVKVSGFLSKDLLKRKRQLEDTINTFIIDEEKKFKEDTGLSIGKILVSKYPIEYRAVYCELKI